MTIKEVCDRTGLSRKTIRLYLEKGLVSPSSEHRNGRTFRTWSEADVRQLEMIASLRRAWFTMEEIRRMQKNPESIREILPGYRQWLLSQKESLDGLTVLRMCMPCPRRFPMSPGSSRFRRATSGPGSDTWTRWRNQSAQIRSREEEAL